MLEYINGWIQNIAVYMVLITIAVQVLPNNNYKKYLRFFTGLLLVVLMIEPILAVFGISEHVTGIYNSTAYQQEIKEIEEATKYLEEVRFSEYIPVDEEVREEVDSIEVEEIQIGE